MERLEWKRYWFRRKTAQPIGSSKFGKVATVVDSDFDGPEVMMVKVYMEGEQQPVKTYKNSDLEIIPKEISRHGMITTGKMVSALLNKPGITNNQNALSAEVDHNAEHALHQDHSAPGAPGLVRKTVHRHRHSIGMAAKLLVQTHGRLKKHNSWRVTNNPAYQSDGFEYVVDPNDSQFRFFVITPGPTRAGVCKWKGGRMETGRLMGGRVRL